MARSKKSSLGNCYQANGKYMMDEWFRNRKLILCHGEVMGQGALEGTPFGHAWVLDGNTVIDVSNGRNIRMPKLVYYALGRINDKKNVHQYTWPQMREKVLKHGHWGPWDLKTSSGL